MKICIFLSRPRSGATVLRKTLGIHPQIVDIGEVFNEENPESFFEFLRRNIGDRPQWIKPSVRIEAFFEYVKYCCENALQWKPDARVVVIDVKYDHLHLIYRGWQGFRSAPALFSMIKERDWTMIHLIRRDVLASVLSNFIARTTKIYHREKDSETPALGDRVHVDISEACAECDASVTQAIEIRELFCEFSHYLEIAYEDMWDKHSEQFESNLMMRVEHFLAVDRAMNLIPKLAKVVRGDPLDYISNAKEIRDLVVPKIRNIPAL